MKTQLKNHGHGVYAVVDPCEPSVALGHVVRNGQPGETSYWEAWTPGDADCLGKQFPTRALAVHAVVGAHIRRTVDAKLPEIQAARATGDWDTVRALRAEIDAVTVRWTR